jgi:hypothetical protein
LGREPLVALGSFGRHVMRAVGAGRTRIQPTDPGSDLAVFEPMGHQILTYRGRYAIVNDFDFAAARHVLLVRVRGREYGRGTTATAF